jgi:DNA-binding HxlR family transcriptional regulator
MDRYAGRVHEPAACEQFHHAVELVGARWTGVIVRAMLAGNVRFGEIRAAAGTSDTMLTRRLRELQREGLVERRVLPTTPVTVEYHLTPAGLELDGVIQAIVDWANRWVAAGGPAAGAQAHPA